MDLEKSPLSHLWSFTSSLNRKFLFLVRWSASIFPTHTRFRHRVLSSRQTPVSVLTTLISGKDLLRAHSQSHSPPLQHDFIQSRPQVFDRVSGLGRVTDQHIYFKITLYSKSKQIYIRFLRKYDIVVSLSDVSGRFEFYK